MQMSRKPQHSNLYDVNLWKKSIFEPHHTHANVFFGGEEFINFYLPSPPSSFSARIETSGEHAERIYVGRASEVKLIRNLFARPCADFLESASTFKIMKTIVHSCLNQKFMLSSQNKFSFRVTRGRFPAIVPHDKDDLLICDRRHKLHRKHLAENSCSL